MEDWAHHHVISLLAERYQLDPATTSPSTSLSAILEDSLDAVELIMHLEEEFDPPRTVTAEEKLETVGDLIELVRRRG